MTQTQMILEYMREHGSITPLEALSELGCMRLASRISDLKNQGYKITKTMARGKNRRDEKIVFARYKLEDDENA